MGPKREEHPRHYACCAYRSMALGIVVGEKGMGEGSYYTVKGLRWKPWLSIHRNRKEGLEHRYRKWVDTVQGVYAG